LASVVICSWARDLFQRDRIGRNRRADLGLVADPTVLWPDRDRLCGIDTPRRTRAATMSLLARLVPGGSGSAEGQRSRSAVQPASAPRSPESTRWTIARTLPAIRWIVLAAAGAVALVLGYIGYTEYFDHLHRIHQLDFGPRWTDCLYHSLTLFIPGSAPTRTGLPIWLDIARFLAPTVAGYAALAGLHSLFRDRVQEIRVPFMKDHVVVCGLGYVGSVFLRHLRDSGAFRSRPWRRLNVVAIELDPANPLIEVWRSSGVPVIVGDAQLKRTLHTAGVQRAADLLAVCAEDAVNTQIMAVAREVAASRRRGELRGLARIGNPHMCEALRFDELGRPAKPSSSVDFFNTDEVGARLLLQEFPPFDVHSRQPHLLISRLDGLGIWLVRHAARLWYETRIEDERIKGVPLWISVVDDHAIERIEALRDHPALEKVCRFVPASISHRAVHELLTKRHAEEAAPPLTRAYVTAYRDEDALETAFKLRSALDAATPLVVALSRTQGVGRLINDASADGELSNRKIKMFPTLESACTVALVRGGSLEPFAEALHNRWRKEKLKKGEYAPTWDELDESRKESSRAQARDIRVKVQNIRCTVELLHEWEAPDFTFTLKEVDQLASAEHGRWILEREAAGWRQVDGDTKADPIKKTTPYMVAFKELPEDIAEYDRVFVREIPTILASAGLQIKRRPQTDPDDPGVTRH
jgi:TrkA-N domain